MRVYLILTQLPQDTIDPFIQNIHFKILTVEMRDQITFIKKVESRISNDNVFLSLQCASWEVINTEKHCLAYLIIQGQTSWYAQLVYQLKPDKVKRVII